MQNNAYKKLITQLSPAIYRLQRVASGFRLAVAENYHARVHIRSLDILVTEHGDMIASTMIRENTLEDGIYVGFMWFASRRPIYTLNRMDSELSYYFTGEPESY